MLTGMYVGPRLAIGSHGFALEKCDILGPGLCLPLIRQFSFAFASG